MNYIELPDDVEEEQGLDEVQQLSEQISTEAMIGDQYINAFTGRLDTFVKGVSTYLKQAFSKDLKVRAGFNTLQIHNFISKYPYTSLAVAELPIPRGLVSDYPTMVEELHKSYKELSGFAVTELPDCVGWLGEMLGEPSKLQSITSGRSSMLSDKGPADTLQGLLACFSDSASHQLKDRPFGSLYPSAQSYERTGARLNDLALMMNELDLSKLNGYLDRADELMRELAKRITNREPGFERISGPQLKYMAEMGWRMASRAEALSTLYYHAVLAANAYRESYEHLKRVYK